MAGFGFDVRDLGTVTLPKQPTADPWAQTPDSPDLAYGKGRINKLAELMQNYNAHYTGRVGSQLISMSNPLLENVLRQGEAENYLNNAPQSPDFYNRPNQGNQFQPASYVAPQY